MDGEKQYRLPIGAMVEIMKYSPDKVLLQAHLASLASLSKQVCFAHVVLEQGGLHSCTIMEKTGRVLLQQQDAYDALVHCGDLNWRVVRTPSVQDLRHGRPVTSTLGSLESTLWHIPTLRVNPVPRETLLALPHAQRVALVLVDGKRSVAVIAQLLTTSPQKIEQTLAALRHLVQF
jgi:hypothetical protein